MSFIIVQIVINKWDIITNILFGQELGLAGIGNAIGAFEDHLLKPPLQVLRERPGPENKNALLACGGNAFLQVAGRAGFEYPPLNGGVPSNADAKTRPPPSKGTRFFSGGEDRIRTCDRGFRPGNRLAGGPIRPLWHLPNMCSRDFSRSFIDD